jgi:hypothetical protein
MPIPRSAPATALTRKALIDAVDYGLLAAGQIVRATIYQCVEERYHIKREEIPDKLDAFYLALQEILGRGAESIKRLIMKSLYIRVGLEFRENKNWTLADYVQNASKIRPT